MAERKKISMTEAYKQLGRIDQQVDSGRITKDSHNKKTKEVLKKLIRSYKED